ncbi:uracil-DNA glycosylase [Daejeonella oryzae]|uniref:uracil-DNA glycosylase n=1 Tax=Daejeonella oryzae TaxID=1122943 RepID=UPI00040BD111|nr:uracil-DNA glycosylase [Daejeonella oryzae]
MSGELDKSWKDVLEDQLNSDNMQQLRKFLKNEQVNGVITYPPNAKIFNAFNHTPFSKVKVVILGQDPYHGKNQAHGLSFSVMDGTAPPPSLKNIFKELKNEYQDYRDPKNGDLTPWADQGVLLLNSVLTVEASKAGSHQKRGWELFTDSVISLLSEKKNGIVFMLWGNYAKDKAVLIDQSKHYILTAAHPSPFSAYNGFFGCNHFIKANEFLQKQNIEKINWQLPD